jgi:hypothetical protein
MQVLTHTNPAMITQGFGGLPGARYDAAIAREALFNARAALKQTRWSGGPDYTFWRRVYLNRVMRFRAAVRKADGEVKEIVAPRLTFLPLAAE